MVDKKQSRGLIKFSEELGASLCVSDSMTEAIRIWSEMYTNEAHWIKGDTKSLNLAQGICREFARLVTLELKSRVEDDEELNQIYNNLIIDKLRPQIEKAMAKGGIVMKPRIDGYGKIQVDFITPENFLPIEFDSDGDITSAIFGSFTKWGKYYYTLCEKHEMVGNNARVDISVYKSRDIASLGKQISSDKFPPCWRGITESYEAVNVAKPLFTYFKTPFPNVVDENSPLGVSIFAGAEEIIRAADEQYSSLLWEFKGGEMAIYADSTALETTHDGDDGEVISEMPKHTKRLVRKFETDETGFYQEFAPTLRDENYLNGMNFILKRIEFLCQLAYGTLSDPQHVDKTAEEIKASKQRSYSAVADIQNSLKNALEDVVKVLDFYMAAIADRSCCEHSVVCVFDDSLACDRETEFKERMELLKAGVISPVEIREWYLGENEETAKKKISAIEVF